MNIPESFKSPRYALCLLATAVLTAALGLSFQIQTASANGSIILIRVLCVPELGYLSFGSLSVDGEGADAALSMAEDELAEKYGLYNLQGYFDVDDDADGRQHLVGARNQRVDCDLGGTPVEIIFEPERLYRDLTVRITLRIDRRLVIDNLPFRDGNREGDGIGGFVYQTGGSFIRIQGHVGPDSSPFFPSRWMSSIFDFGPRIPPLSDFRSVIDKIIEDAKERDR